MLFQNQHSFYIENPLACFLNDRYQLKRPKQVLILFLFLKHHETILFLQVYLTWTFPRYLYTYERDPIYLLEHREHPLLYIPILYIPFHNRWGREPPSHQTYQHHEKHEPLNHLCLFAINYCFYCVCTLYGLCFSFYGLAQKLFLQN